MIFLLLAYIFIIIVTDRKQKLKSLCRVRHVVPLRSLAPCCSVAGPTSTCTCRMDSRMPSSLGVLGTGAEGMYIVAAAAGAAGARDRGAAH
jgi:hypothetical protein